ncbi:MAG: hypothetical protein ACOYBX_12290 [Mycobacterium sp.]
MASACHRARNNGSVGRYPDSIFFWKTRESQQAVAQFLRLGWTSDPGRAHRLFV